MVTLKGTIRGHWSFRLIGQCEPGEVKLLSLYLFRASLDHDRHLALPGDIFGCLKQARQGTGISQVRGLGFCSTSHIVQPSHTTSTDCSILPPPQPKVNSIEVDNTHSGAIHGSAPGLGWEGRQGMEPTLNQPSSDFCGHLGSEPVVCSLSHSLSIHFLLVSH